MFRTALIAAALMVPALPALAATDATPGALAGRSPHKAYVSAEAKPACAATMIALPAGKLPVYGTHALPKAACADRLLASADQPVKTVNE